MPTALRTSRSALVRSAQLVLVAGGLAVILGLAARAAAPIEHPPGWAAIANTVTRAESELRPGWLRTGDVLADGTVLTARAAYLLAFHEAQDRRELAGMLAAAARLERLGDRVLARELREAAAHEAASPAVGRRPAGDQRGL